MEDRYMALYETNKEFHDYVDRLMNPKKNFGGRSLEEVLSMRTVRDVGDYYAKISATPESPLSPVSPHDFCECEDKSC